MQTQILTPEQHLNEWVKHENIDVSDRHIQDFFSINKKPFVNTRSHNQVDTILDDGKDVRLTTKSVVADGAWLSHVVATKIGVNYELHIYNACYNDKVLEYSKVIYISETNRKEQIAHHYRITHKGDMTLDKVSDHVKYFGQHTFMKLLRDCMVNSYQPLLVKGYNSAALTERLRALFGCKEISEAMLVDENKFSVNFTDGSPSSMLEENTTWHVASLMEYPASIERKFGQQGDIKTKLDVPRGVIPLIATLGKAVDQYSYGSLVVQVLESTLIAAIAVSSTSLCFYYHINLNLTITGCAVGGALSGALIAAVQWDKKKERLCWYPDNGRNLLIGGVLGSADYAAIHLSLLGATKLPIEQTIEDKMIIAGLAMAMLLPIVNAMFMNFTVRQP